VQIDWDRLSALRDDIGEEDFADVAIVFISEIGEKLAELTAQPAAASADDFHFLRGSAVNLGLAALAEACTSAERACAAGEPPDVTGVAAEFDAALASLSAVVPGVARAA
jgi:HPt (histidine-containing phosphotransfer) domain-containing protein